MREFHSACDVVVVGGGIAGLTAALRLSQGGKSVMLCERGADDDYLCNTRMSSGAIHCAQHDVDLAPAELEDVLTERTAGVGRPDLVSAVAKTSARFVRWLQSTGVPMTKGQDYPPVAYTIQPPALVPDVDGWKDRGSDRMMKSMEAELHRLGVALNRGFDVQSLLAEDGRVAGIEGTCADGQQFTIRAQSVILAGGGFEANHGMLRERGIRAPEKLFPRHAGAGIGSCLRMAVEVGAVATTLGGFYGHVLSKDAFANDRLSPFPYLDPILQAGIAVDANGRRFADEGQGGTAVANAIARLDDPSTVTVIIDEKIWTERGIDNPPAPCAPNPRLPDMGGSVNSRDDLRELAAAAGIPGDVLIAEIQSYNSALKTGRAHTLTPPRSNAKGAPMPIEAGPFYAIPACAAISYTMDGITIDGSSRVLDTAENPIPGLYAAGCATGGLEGGTPPAYINGLLKSGVTALIAAETILETPAGLGLR